VGEIWDVSDVVATYAGSDVDLAFEFSLAEAILSSVSEGWLAPLESAMKEVQRLYPEGGYAPFLANHDQNRVMDQLYGDLDKARLAAALLLTLPGVPFIYYGEEIGMTGSKPDELIRTPMQWAAGPQTGFTAGTPWQPLNEGYETTNVEVQLAEPGSLLQCYRTLIALRRAHPALNGGDFFPVQSAGRTVYAFLRQSADEQILVVVNLGDKAESQYALKLAESPLSTGEYAATDLLTGTEVASLAVGTGGAVKGYQPQPQVSPRTALILQLTRDGE
jgi:glycosidase